MEQLRKEAPIITDEAEVVTEMPTTVVEAASSLHDILGAMISIGEVTPEVFFPNVDIDHDELSKLASWAEGKWKIIFNEPGVTLTKRPVPDELIWEAEDA